VRARTEASSLPECLDNYVGEDNPVRVVEAFVEERDLAALGFADVVPEEQPVVPRIIPPHCSRFICMTT
jgi:hypothetical protein